MIGNISLTFNEVCELIALRAHLIISRESIEGFDVLITSANQQQLSANLKAFKMKICYLHLLTK